MTVEQLRALIEGARLAYAPHLAGAELPDAYAAAVREFQRAFDPVLCARLLAVAEAAQATVKAINSPWEGYWHVPADAARALDDLDRALAAVVLPEGKPE